MKTVCLVCWIPPLPGNRGAAGRAKRIKELLLGICKFFFFCILFHSMFHWSNIVQCSSGIRDENSNSYSNLCVKNRFSFFFGYRGHYGHWSESRAHLGAYQNLLSKKNPKNVDIWKKPPCNQETMAHLFSGLSSIPQACSVALDRVIMLCRLWKTASAYFFRLLWG